MVIFGLAEGWCGVGERDDGRDRRDGEDDCSEGQPQEAQIRQHPCRSERDGKLIFWEALSLRLYAIFETNLNGVSAAEAQSTL
jgi:hypothetical protein